MQGRRIARLLSLVTLVVPTIGFASDFGCKVLLCLADPRGPTTESECKPPIRKLFRDLARGKPFPKCDMASGPNGTSYAKQGYSYYDNCPAGLTALPAGEHALPYKETKANQRARTWGGYGSWRNESEVLRGVGEGFGVSPSYDSPLGPKVCVGKVVGSAIVGTNDNSYSVNVYDQIVTIDPAKTPRYIDVFIDDKLHQRVRW